ncbi:TPA: hypothetical protein ACF1U5_000752, partial [Enterococcus hirae]
KIARKRMKLFQNIKKACPILCTLTSSVGLVHSHTLLIPSLYVELPLPFYKKKHLAKKIQFFS